MKALPWSEAGIERDNHTCQLWQISTYGSKSPAQVGGGRGAQGRGPQGRGPQGRGPQGRGPELDQNLETELLKRPSLLWNKEYYGNMTGKIIPRLVL